MGTEVEEISVVIVGRIPNQAFFLEDRFWGMPLKDVRDLFVAQDLSLPLHYKFMTNAKNVISHPAEEKITLKMLLSTPTFNQNEEHDNKSSLKEDPEEELIKDLSAENIPPLTITKIPPTIVLHPIRPAKKKGKTKSHHGECCTDTETDQNDVNAECSGGAPTDKDSQELNQCQSEDGESRNGDGQDQENTNPGPSPKLRLRRPCPVQSLNRLFFNHFNDAEYCPFQLTFRMFIKGFFALLFSLLITLLMCGGTLYTVTMLVGPMDDLFTGNGDHHNLGVQIHELERSMRRLDKLSSTAFRDTEVLGGEFQTLKQQMAFVNQRMDQISVEMKQGKGRDEKDKRDEKFGGFHHGQHGHGDSQHQKYEKKKYKMGG